MNAFYVNRVSRWALVVFSITALITVLTGLGQKPLPDEGTGAHIFQIAIVTLVLTGLIFVATADWTKPGRIIRSLLLPTTATALAFGALYYLEHWQ